MLWPKKIIQGIDNEKKFLRLENSPPPITFLMVRPLVEVSYYWACDYVGVLPVREVLLTSCCNVTL